MTERRIRDRPVDVEEEEIVESIECPNCGCDMHEQQIRCRECGERRDKNNSFLGLF